MGTVRTVVVIGGGQSGLAGLEAAVQAGLPSTLLEASAQVAGSWPHLRLARRRNSRLRWCGAAVAPRKKRDDAARPVD